MRIATGKPAARHSLGERSSPSYQSMQALYEGHTPRTTSSFRCRDPGYRSILEAMPFRCAAHARGTRSSICQRGGVVVFARGAIRAFGVYAPAGIAPHNALHGAACSARSSTRHCALNGMSTPFARAPARTPSPSARLRKTCRGRQISPSACLSSSSPTRRFARKIAGPPHISPGAGEAERFPPRRPSPRRRPSRRGRE